MRLVGILVVVGIIGFAYTRWAKSPDITKEAMKEADAVMSTPVAQVAGATPAPAQPGAPSSGLRRPIDRTRQVLEQVKGRNGAGEF
jgi:hypothetical protein